MALEATVLASRATVAPAPALAAPGCPLCTMWEAVPTWGLSLKSTSSTHILRDGSAHACGLAHRQSVPVAGLFLGHQPQQWTCYNLGYAREGKGITGKGVTEPNIREQLSHSNPLPARHPKMGPQEERGAAAQLPTTTITLGPPTSKHQYQGDLGREVGKLRPGEGNQGQARGAVPSTGTAQAAADATQHGGKGLSLSGTRSGSRGGQPCGNKDGNRADKTQGPWHPAWL